jgi:hypothetical protein
MNWFLAPQHKNTLAMNGQRARLCLLLQNLEQHMGTILNISHLEDILNEWAIEDGCLLGCSTV